MKRIAMLAVLVGLMGLGGLAQAEILGGASACNGELLTHPAKVQVCVPAGWTKEVKEGVLKIKDSKDWKVSLRIETVDAGNLDAALKKLDAKISDLVTVKWGDPVKIKKDEKDNPNHMDGVVISGPGTRADNHANVKVIAAIVAAPSDKMVLVSIIGDIQYLSNDQNAAVVKTLLDSIQPSK